MLEDKKLDPLSRLWHISLLLLGIVLTLWLALQVLAAIWGWLLLIGAAVGAGATLVVWIRHRRNGW